jgi:hypothetical protein
MYPWVVGANDIEHAEIGPIKTSSARRFGVAVGVRRLRGLSRGKLDLLVKIVETWRFDPIVDQDESRRQGPKTSRIRG